MFYVFYTRYAISHSLSLSVTCFKLMCSVCVTLFVSLSLTVTLTLLALSYTLSLGVGLFFVTHTLPPNTLFLSPHTNPTPFVLCCLPPLSPPHTHVPVSPNLSLSLYQSVTNSFSVSISLPAPCRSNKS